VGRGGSRGGSGGEKSLLDVGVDCDGLTIPL